MARTRQRARGGVYLLHFAKPYRHAAHYVGWAKNIEARVADHKQGVGARLTQVVREAGIEMELARTWPGESRTFERRLKNRHGAGRFCPVCAELARKGKVTCG